jgi:hypothetical protein
MSNQPIFRLPPKCRINLIAQNFTHKIQCNHAILHFNLTKLQEYLTKTAVSAETLHDGGCQGESCNPPHFKSGSYSCRLSAKTAVPALDQTLVIFVVRNDFNNWEVGILLKWLSSDH